MNLSKTEFVSLGLSERYAVREDVAAEEQLLTFYMQDGMI